MATDSIQSAGGICPQGRTAAGLPPKRRSVKASTIYCFMGCAVVFDNKVNKNLDYPMIIPNLVIMKKILVYLAAISVAIASMA